MTVLYFTLPQLFHAVALASNAVVCDRHAFTSLNLKQNPEQMCQQFIGMRAGNEGDRMGIFSIN